MGVNRVGMKFGRVAQVGQSFRSLVLRNVKLAKKKIGGEVVRFQTQRDLELFCCLGNTPAVAVPRPATSSASPISIRAARSGEAGRGRSFFSSASSSEKSFMDDKVLFERGEGVAITRGRGVL